MQLRTLFRNGDTISPFPSMPCALILSPRGCTHLHALRAPAANPVGKFFGVRHYENRTYKTPGGMGVQTFNFQLCVSVSLWQIPCSQQLAASLTSLCLFSAPRLFVFNSLQPLLPKHPGVWRCPSLFDLGQKTRGHAGACPLRNSDPLRVDYALTPLLKLATASASVLYTSKTVRSLVICRTS
jgi:hypothetical protein